MGWLLYLGGPIGYTEIHLRLAYFLVFRWDRLGDIVVLPVSSFKDPVWDSFGDELWSIVAKSLGGQRLARQVWFVIITASKLPWCLLHSFFFIGFKPISACQFGVAHVHFVIQLLFLGLSFCTVDGTHMEIGYWL